MPLRFYFARSGEPLLAVLLISNEISSDRVRYRYQRARMRRGLVTNALALGSGIPPLNLTPAQCAYASSGSNAAWLLGTIEPGSVEIAFRQERHRAWGL